MEHRKYLKKLMKLQFYSIEIENICLKVKNIKLIYLKRRFKQK